MNILNNIKLKRQKRFIEKIKGLVCSNNDNLDTMIFTSLHSISKVIIGRNYNRKFVDISVTNNSIALFYPMVKDTDCDFIISFRSHKYEYKEKLHDGKWELLRFCETSRSS